MHSVGMFGILRTSIVMARTILVGEGCAMCLPVVSCDKIGHGKFKGEELSILSVMATIHEPDGVRQSKKLCLARFTGSDSRRETGRESSRGNTRGVYVGITLYGRHVSLR